MFVTADDEVLFCEGLPRPQHLGRRLAVALAQGGTVQQAGEWARAAAAKVGVSVRVG